MEREREREKERGETSFLHLRDMLSLRGADGNAGYPIC